MSSGLNEIKKKTKLSIDEMYDNQSVGKMDFQFNGDTEKNQTTQTQSQESRNQEINIPDNMYVHQDVSLDSPINRFKSQPPKQQQQMIKEPTYKMTFTMPKDVYKAFNDIYAQRMLKGCKTDKSELFSEAIQLLKQMEKE